MFPNYGQLNFAGAHMCHSYGGREELKVKCRMIVTEGRKEERAQTRAPRARPEMLAAGQDVEVGLKKGI